MSINQLLDLRNATDTPFKNVTGLFPTNTRAHDGNCGGDCKSPGNCIDCNGGNCGGGDCKSPGNCIDCGGGNC